MPAPLVKYDPKKVTAFTPEEAAELSQSNQVLGQASATSPTGFELDPEWGASFAGLSDQMMRDLEAQKTALASTDAELRADRDRQATRIGANYDITEEQIMANREEQVRQMNIARENLTGITLKRNVEDFTANVKQVFGNIDRSLERLRIEEDVALETNNGQYLDALRKIKIDALTSQQNMIEQSVRMFQAYEQHLTSRQNRAFQAEDQQMQRLEFYLENGLIEGATQDDLNDIAADTNMTPRQITEAWRYRKAEDEKKKGEGPTIPEDEYEKAEQFLADNLDASYEELRSGILRHTKLADTDVTALLNARGYEGKEGVWTDSLIEDVARKTVAGGKNKDGKKIKGLGYDDAIAKFSGDNVTVVSGGKTISLSRGVAQRIVEAIKKAYPEGKRTFKDKYAPDWFSKND